MMDINELKERRKKIEDSTNKTLGNMKKIENESRRVADIAHNAENILGSLDAEFERQTGLDSRDVTFLFFATALQIGRWVVINQINKQMSQKISDKRLKDNDSSIKEMEREARDKFKDNHDGWSHNKSEKYPSWLEIVYDGVPYDVSIGSPKFGVNMGGGYHRVHTLGHDPILGWIFGTMNIISSTITLEDFRTFKISSEPRPKHWSAQSNLIEGFAMALESIKEDEKRLPAAIFAQAIHLKSDVNTKKGLPIPLLECFDAEYAGKLYKENYDLLCLSKDIAVVGSQAVFAILINMIISLIHGLYYDEDKYPNRDIYEVKTRKILMYSNLISSASNLIWVGGNMFAGNETAIKDLDIGGLMVTMYRLISDEEFIHRVKEEFVFGNFKQMIKGEALELEDMVWD